MFLYNFNSLFLLNKYSRIYQNIFLNIILRFNIQLCNFFLFETIAFWVEKYISINKKLNIFLLLKE